MDNLKPVGGLVKREIPVRIDLRESDVDHGAQAMLRPTVTTIFVFLLSCAFGTPAARAQATTQPAAAATAPSHAGGFAPVPGADLRIYLMTLSPGSIIYERFGHNTIVVHDPNPSPERVDARQKFDDEFYAKYGGYLRSTEPLILPTDRAHHYGAFDFDQPGFVPRFIMGRMEYWTTSEWADLTAILYSQDNRSVLLQELNLTPKQKLELKTFLEWNERPENRFYRYDYYRDNCSTRVRDAIDRATGGELKTQLTSISTGTTFRSHTRRLTSGLNPVDLFWFTGFTYVLGHPVDEPLSAWDESFLPEKLAEHVRTVTLHDESGGGTRPLVLREQYFHQATQPSMPQTEPRRLAGYLLTGLLVGAAFFSLARLSLRSRLARWAFAVLIVPWALVWGIGACIGAWGWGVSDHAASYRNENLLQMTPLLLAFVVLGPMLALARRSRPRMIKFAKGLALAGAGLSILGLLLKVLPAFWQHNGEIIAVALPANIGLALAVYRLARRLLPAGIPEGSGPPAETKTSKHSGDKR